MNINGESKINSSSVFLKSSKNDIVKCIFLCEFHVTAGRKIVVQVPEDYMSKEKFETVSRYVIPQAQLQRSFLSVSLLGFKILGYPVRIDHKQYARNAFYFNVCFVFEPTTRTIGYEPIVRKLSEYLLAMEISSRLLSQQQSAVQISRLCRILAQVRNDINSKKVCMLQEGSTLIPLCVVPRYKETVKVYPHQAAALTDEFYKYVEDQWDLTTQRILPYIDGFNHINRITALADVALELVCDCIKHLVILGVCVLVPVFQYSNVYRPTPKLSQLAKCKELQQKCVQKCSKPGRQNANVRDIFRIFASMAHGATFGELCVRFNPAALNINEKQMVLFGQLEGLIRRVDRYPVTVSRNLFANYEGDITKQKVGATAGISTTPTFDAATATTITTIPTEHEEFKPRTYMRLPSKPLPRGGPALRGRFICRIPSIMEDNNDSNENQGIVYRNHHQQEEINESPPNQIVTTSSSNIYSSKEKPMEIVYNGSKSFDEICCTTGMSCQQLDAYLARDKHVIVLLK